MFEALVQLATKVAGLLEEKEKNKYLDEILKIKKVIDSEEKKSRPDDYVISDYELKLMRLTRTLGNAIVAKKT